MGLFFLSQGYSFDQPRWPGFRFFWEDGDTAQ